MSEKQSEHIWSDFKFYEIFDSKNSTKIELKLFSVFNKSERSFTKPKFVFYLTDQNVKKQIKFYLKFSILFKLVFELNRHSEMIKSTNEFNDEISNIDVENKGTKLLIHTSKIRKNDRVIKNFFIELINPNFDVNKLVFKFSNETEFFGFNYFLKNLMDNYLNFLTSSYSIFQKEVEIQIMSGSVKSKNVKIANEVVDVIQPVLENISVDAVVEDNAVNNSEDLNEGNSSELSGEFNKFMDGFEKDELPYKPVALKTDIKVELSDTFKPVLKKLVAGSKSSEMFFYENFMNSNINNFSRWLDVISTCDDKTPDVYKPFKFIVDKCFMSTDVYSEVLGSVEDCEKFETYLMNCVKYSNKYFIENGKYPNIFYYFNMEKFKDNFSKFDSNENFAKFEKLYMQILVFYIFNKMLISDISTVSKKFDFTKIDNYTNLMYVDSFLKHPMNAIAIVLKQLDYKVDESYVHSIFDYFVSNESLYSFYSDFFKNCGITDYTLTKITHENIVELTENFFEAVKKLDMFDDEYQNSEEFISGICNGGIGDIVFSK